MPVDLQGLLEAAAAAPRGYVPRIVYVRADDLRRFGRTAGCRRGTLMTNGEAARGVPHTRACRDRFEQAMVEANDDRVQAATDRRDRDRDGQAVALAEQPVHVAAARPISDRDAEGGAARGGGEDEELAFDPDGDQHVRTAHGDVEDHGDGDGAMQVEREVFDSVFSNWPQEQGAAATELLDLFLVHGVESGVARLKVSELFSPPRPTVLPRAIPDFSAFAPGSIFDLRCDRDGLALAFLRADHRRAVRLRIKEEEPYLVVGSPLCIEFTDLFWKLRAHKVDPQVVRQRRIEAEILLRFACEIFEMQMAMGNHFLHEHPAGADSWKTPWVHSLR